MQSDVTPWHIPRQLLQKSALMISASSRQLSTIQWHCNRDFDKNVLLEPTFKVGHYVFVDSSQLAAWASGTVNVIANRRYSQLLRRVSGPYEVLSVQRCTITIQEVGIPNTVSINHLTLSSTREQMTESLHERCILHHNQIGINSDKTLLKTQNERKRWYNCTARVRGKVPNASCGHSIKKKVCTEMVWIWSGKWYRGPTTPHTHALFRRYWNGLKYIRQRAMHNWVARPLLKRWKTIQVRRQAMRKRDFTGSANF